MYRYAAVFPGAQPEIFLGRGGFVKLRHFDKHFLKKLGKKAPQRKILEFFFLDTFKTAFWMANLTYGWTQSGHFFQVARLLSEISTLFYGVSYYFSKWLPRNLRKILWKMSMVMSSFSNGESVGLPTLLKTESTADILIDQIHKFQKSCY